MIPLSILIGAVLLAVPLLAWCLCRAAADADRMTEDALNRDDQEGTP